MKNITEIVDRYDKKYYETIDKKSKEVLSDLENFFGVDFRKIEWAKDYSDYDLFRTVRLICIDNGSINNFIDIAQKSRICK